jgi:N-acetylneuraminic acid mutarotase
MYRVRFALFSVVLLACWLNADCSALKALHWETLPNGGNIPKGAAGASMVEINNRLYVVFGVEECAALNTSAAVNARFRRTAKTWPQAATAFAEQPSSDQGLGTTVCAGNEFYNDVYYYDLGSQTWTKPIVLGTKPAARSFQRGVSRGNNGYYYGGVTYSSISGQVFIPYGDFWRFDAIANVWTQLTNDPGIRVDAGMAVDDALGNIYLGFGLSGFGGTPEQNCKNDLWRYNIASATWTQLIANNPNNTLQPPVRYQARMEFNAKSNVILLYGGDVLPDNTRNLYDTWIYFVVNNTWQLLDNASFIPLFTGASATFGRSFFLFTGEMRGGIQVCFHGCR